MTTFPLFDVVVAGAGIHGIHLTRALLENGVVDPRRFAVIDPAGSPFAVWHRRVRNCGMDYLRSNGSHSIAEDFYSLRNMMGPGDWIPPYHRPATTLFARQLDDASADLPPDVTTIRGRVEAVDSRHHRDAPHRYTVSWSPPSGSNVTRHTVNARCVILAPGQPEPLVPESFRSAPPGSVIHIHDDRFNPQEIPPGSRILIVGGGIAAFHLALYLARRRISVQLWHRDPITVHQFDSDPCFVGPRCSEAFSAISKAEDRHLLIDRSRRGGSVPPDLYRRVMREVLHNRIVLQRRVVESPLPRYDDFQLIILSTGFSAAPPAAALVRQISSTLDAPVSSRGYPLPGADLAWLPGLYVTGGLADLVLGPPARNIIGAHLARRRIVPSLSRVLKP